MTRQSVSRIPRKRPGPLFLACIFVAYSTVCMAVGANHCSAGAHSNNGRGCTIQSLSRALCNERQTEGSREQLGISGSFFDSLSSLTDCGLHGLPFDGQNIIRDSIQLTSPRLQRPLNQLRNSICGNVKSNITRSRQNQSRPFDQQLGRSSKGRCCFSFSAFSSPFLPSFGPRHNRGLSPTPSTALSALPALSTSSPIMASLFFRSFWKRRNNDNGNGRGSTYGRIGGRGRRTKSNLVPSPKHMEAVENSSSSFIPGESHIADHTRSNLNGLGGFQTASSSSLNLAISPASSSSSLSYSSSSSSYLESLAEMTDVSISEGEAQVAEIGPEFNWALHPMATASLASTASTAPAESINTSNAANESENNEKNEGKSKRRPISIHTYRHPFNYNHDQPSSENSLHRPNTATNGHPYFENEFPSSFSPPSSSESWAQPSSFLPQSYIANAASAIQNAIPAMGWNRPRNGSNDNTLTLYGLGLSKHQFATWVQYYLRFMTKDGEALDNIDGLGGASIEANEKNAGLAPLDQIKEHITAKEVDWDSDEWDRRLPKLRSSWKAGKVICEHTNILSGSRRRKSKKSTKIEGDSNEEGEGKTVGNAANAGNNLERSNNSGAEGEDAEKKRKGEQFRDVLSSYAERLVDILKDEMSDAHFVEGVTSMQQYPTNFGEVIGVIPDDRLDRHSAMSMYFAEGNGQAHPLEGSSFTDEQYYQYSQASSFGEEYVHNQYPSQYPQHLDGSQLMQKQENINGRVALPKWSNSDGLRGWIEKEYGIYNTQMLIADTLLKRSEQEQLKTLQHFLDWFRSKFPYYHDKCSSCGASCKDEPEINSPNDAAGEVNVGEGTNGEAVICNNAIEVNTGLNANLQGVDDEREDEEDEDMSFLGYIYPTPTERHGNASRTEIYQCRSCHSFTRFPRYNKALWVTSTQRGRCGEYSMLLYRMLRSLGYEHVRWVVDWADHVWAEVWLGDAVGVDGRGDERSGFVGGNPLSANENDSKKGRWVHLDPCEAAVDNPLLYESWGKNQTYIVAFYAPPALNGYTALSGLAAPMSKENMSPSITFGSQSLCFDGSNFPPVEDVTQKYTSDDIGVIGERRGISEEFVSDSISEVSQDLIQMLQTLL